MKEIKIATFNVEWMYSIFGGLWKNWQSPYIPVDFPGKKIGGIYLEPIVDVPALCNRIAGVIRDIDAKIIGIEEGPPLKEQMETFVERFLNDDYVVHYSNARSQSICALVHRSISEDVTAFAPNSQETKVFRSKTPYYTWGDITKEDQKFHKFHRIPLVLTFQPEAGKELRIIIVHTKSKYSKLKSREQWDNRDREAIMDALDARQALSAETVCLRVYLNSLLESPHQNRSIVVMGDFNDGPFAELMEREFLIHNIIDELAGSLLSPMSHFQHAMTPDILSNSSTTSFPDPLENGQVVEEMIDHILISPGIWQETALFNLKPVSCHVENNAYDNHYADNGLVRKRGLRPSDHKPVSAIFTY